MNLARPNDADPGGHGGAGWPVIWFPQREGPLHPALYSALDLAWCVSGSCAEITHLSNSQCLILSSVSMACPAVD